MNRKAIPKQRHVKASAPRATASEPTPGLVFRDFVRLLEELAETRESKTRTHRSAPRRRR